MDRAFPRREAKKREGRLVCCKRTLLWFRGEVLIPKGTVGRVSIAYSNQAGDMWLLEIAWYTDHGIECLTFDYDDYIFHVEEVTTRKRAPALH
jgi:hypothetical protein